MLGKLYILLLTFLTYYVSQNCPLCQPIDYENDDVICLQVHKGYAMIKPYVEPIVDHYNTSPLKPVVDKGKNAAIENYHHFVAPKVDQYLPIVQGLYNDHAKAYVDLGLAKIEQFKVPDEIDIEYFKNLALGATETKEASIEETFATTETATEVKEEQPTKSVEPTAPEAEDKLESTVAIPAEEDFSIAETTTEAADIEEPVSDEENAFDADADSNEDVISIVKEAIESAEAAL
ncbi:hypothetical protein DAMA08_012460 [Martiniozyma asiatica (nom. inval.)]|nr:hypothetical protein DAMA08_012460 [Martiniozyma asiatica]